MQSFSTLAAPALPLAMENVDTDQLIPARFMKESRAEGYGRFLLHDLRFDDEGRQRNFILNHEAAPRCEILVSRRNFGAGSSREAAVYALVDFGIRCVIAPSYGDIFAANAVNNGLLPAQVSEHDAEHLLNVLAQEPDTLCVDLASQTIAVDSDVLAFDIASTWKTKLLNGWDDIDLTMAQSAAIAAFHEDYRQRFPWAARLWQ